MIRRILLRPVRSIPLPGVVDGVVAFVSPEEESPNLRPESQGTKPLRSDYKIKDLKQAKAKLTRMMVGRLAIARAMIEAKTPEELKKRLEEMAKHFERIRFWSHDEPKEKEK